MQFLKWLNSHDFPLWLVLPLIAVGAFWVALTTYIVGAVLYYIGGNVALIIFPVIICHALIAYAWFTRKKTPIEDKEDDLGEDGVY